MCISAFLFHWKTFGFRKAFQWARLAAPLRRLLLLVLFISAILLTFSEYAGTVRKEQASEVISQGLEIAALRDIVALCINDGARGVLKIGEEYFLCGISPLGSFASRKGS